MAKIIVITIFLDLQQVRIRRSLFELWTEPPRVTDHQLLFAFLEEFVEQEVYGVFDVLFEFLQGNDVFLALHQLDDVSGLDWKTGVLLLLLEQQTKQSGHLHYHFVVFLQHGLVHSLDSIQFLDLSVLVEFEDLLPEFALLLVQLGLVDLLSESRIHFVGPYCIRHVSRNVAEFINYWQYNNFGL